MPPLRRSTESTAYDSLARFSAIRFRVSQWVLEYRSYLSVYLMMCCFVARLLRDPQVCLLRTRNPIPKPQTPNPKPQTCLPQGVYTTGDPGSAPSTPTSKVQGLRSQVYDLPFFSAKSALYHPLPPFKGRVLGTSFFIPHSRTSMPVG